MFNVIKKNNDISLIFKEGKVVYLKSLTLIYKKNNENISRVAFIASKKLGNAVSRNYCKRRMREIYKIKSYLFKDLDLLMIAKPNMKIRKFKYILKEFRFLKKYDF